ncbi:MAG: beta-lactamase family protein, partial [Candidatus Delongbacteria bacterium]|nr:beta-lactamase family protein [Candidatus Delongbacteria bacterium]
MKHGILILGLIVLPIMILMMVCSKDENQQLDDLMSSTYTPDRPGAAIAVVKNGEVVFKKGYGIADLDTKAPITSSTNFNICSMTKAFTAYAVLDLAAQGKLSLDDPIIKFFPDFNPMTGNQITVRHLLTHSSGMVDHYGYVDQSLFTEFWDKDVLNAVKSVDSTCFPVGTCYRYSNTAFCLSAQIIEQVTGQSYPDFIKTDIFQPLQMNASDVIKPDFAIAQRAMGYRFENDSFIIADAAQSLFFSTQGDGGIYTSIDDYLKWISAIQSGHGLNADQINAAQSPQFYIDSTKHFAYGFGWFTAGTGDDWVIYHTGSNGGFRTIIMMKPSQKYAVVV